MPELLVFQVFTSYYPLFLQGLYNACIAMAAGMVLATVLGFACALITYNDRGVCNKLVRAYITFVRNTPFMVQMYLCYYAFSLTAFQTGVLTLMLNSGAYLSDIVKSGLQAVEKGQIEAAEAIGLTAYQRFRFIIMPQAMPQIVPAAAGQYMIMFQDTSLISAISYFELTRAIMKVGGDTYLFMESFIIGGIIYLIVLNIMEYLSIFLERRFKVRIPGRRLANG